MQIALPDIFEEPFTREHRSGKDSSVACYAIRRVCTFVRDGPLKMILNVIAKHTWIFLFLWRSPAFSFLASYWDAGCYFWVYNADSLEMYIFFKKTAKKSIMRCEFCKKRKRP